MGSNRTARELRLQERQRRIEAAESAPCWCQVIGCIEEAQYFRVDPKASMQKFCLKHWPSGTPFGTPPVDPAPVAGPKWMGLTTQDGPPAFNADAQRSKEEPTEVRTDTEIPAIVPIAPSPFLPVAASPVASDPQASSPPVTPASLPASVPLTKEPSMKRPVRATGINGQHLDFSDIDQAAKHFKVTRGSLYPWLSPKKKGLVWNGHTFSYLSPGQTDIAPRRKPGRKPRAVPPSPRPPVPASANLPVSASVIVRLQAQITKLQEQIAGLRYAIEVIQEAAS